MAVTIAGGMVIDGSGREPSRGDVVVIEGDRIVSVAGPVAGPVVDIEGLTLLPGLIDAHTHLGSVPGVRAPYGEVSWAEMAAQLFRNCELAVDAGFTTCRDANGVDGGIVRAIDQGLVRGPRVLPSASAIAQDGGHATLMQPFSDEWRTAHLPGLVNAKAVCDDPDAVRAAARRNFRRGATQIKIMATGGVVSLTDALDEPQLTVEEMRAAVHEAAARGSYCMAHAHGRVGARNAIEAGVRSIEHGTYLDEETLALMAARGVALVPTFAVFERIGTEAERWGLPPSVGSRAAGVAPAMARVLETARAHEVLVGSGSDLLGAEQTHRGREVVLRAEQEDVMTAIASATRDNARVLGLGRELGTIEEGKIADVIAVAGDPLSDPSVLDDPARIVLVMRSGRVVKDTDGRAPWPVH